MFRHLGVDVYGKGSCSDPGLTCDRKADDKCLQMLNTTYKVTPWLRVLIRAWKRSIRRFVITEKAPTRAFSWLKAPTSAFTFMTLLRHYASQPARPL